MLARIVFFLLLASTVTVAAALTGLLVGKLQLWPHEPLRTLYGHVTTLLKVGAWERDGRIFRAPNNAAGQPVTVHEPDRWMPGYRAIMGWNEEHDQFRIWLLDATGEVVHEWPIEYHRIDPDGPLNGREDPHGMQVLKDGSVLVNFDWGDALARLDPCGEPIWVQRGVFHHMIEAGEDGTFWTWQGNGSAIGHDQHLVNFDGATGKILKKLSLIDDFLDRTPAMSAIFGVPPGFEFKRGDSASHDLADDLFHPNDIEPLSPEQAAKFPAFRAGDLMVSFRILDLVAVLDPVEKSVKWWRRGPWRRQHDPDFGDDGRIVVFSNNSQMGRSTLIAVDPASDEIELAFIGHDLAFYTPYHGLHQELPNDTRLLVIPMEGRVLEATWDGDVVFEFNNTFSDGFNARVVNAVWLPVDYFDAEPVCPAS